MADINVNDTIGISDASYETPNIVNAAESLTVSDSAAVAGRFAYLPESMLLPMQEQLIFNTQILQSHNRTEQRIALRKGYPERRFNVQIALKSDYQVSRFENKLHAWLKRSWLFPFWPVAEYHTDTINAGDTSIELNTANMGFKVGGYAMIRQDENVYDIVTIGSITASQLNLMATPENDYFYGCHIMPCLPSVCIGAAVQDWTYGGAIFDLTFRVKRTDDVIDYEPEMVYGGFVVLNDPSKNESNPFQYNYNPDFAVLDAGTGLFDIVSNSDLNEASQLHGWPCDSKAEAWQLRQMFHYINGQQKGLLVPTFHDDIRLSRPAGSADTTIYAVNTGMADNLGINDMRTYLAFRPPGADIIVRKVTGIVEIDSAEEAITINAAPGVAFERNDYLCWVDLCRLSEQAINFDWYRMGKCFIETGLTRIKIYTDPIMEIYVHDDLNLSDENDNDYILGINRSDGITLTENITARLNLLRINVSDSLTVADQENVSVV